MVVFLGSKIPSWLFSGTCGAILRDSQKRRDKRRFSRFYLHITGIVIYPIGTTVPRYPGTLVMEAVYLQGTDLPIRSTDSVSYLGT